MKWIKRDDRFGKLPDDGEVFLARVMYPPKQRPDYRPLVYDEGRWLDDFDGEQIEPEEVTHWMALEEPED
jgi:hypothetical protein